MAAAGNMGGEIRFDDGAAYERLMGRWSRLAGEQFLDWLDAPAGLRWVDVGCGNGAFTELLLQRCAPAEVLGCDPSPAQLDYARGRLPASAPVRWAEGDAMRLPAPDAGFDAATMALVLFFVPDPAAGLAETLRCLRPGGLLAAYHWDMLEGGFPLAAIGAEMMKLGIPPRLPPSVAAAGLAASVALWQAAGLHQLRSCQITVQREFDSFADYWEGAMASNTLRPMFEALAAEQKLELLQANVRRRLGLGEADGPLQVSARANAVCGIKA